MNIVLLLMHVNSYCIEFNAHITNENMSMARNAGDWYHQQARSEKPINGTLPDRRLLVEIYTDFDPASKPLEHDFKPPDKPATLRVGGKFIREAEYNLIGCCRGLSIDDRNTDHPNSVSSAYFYPHGLPHLCEETNKVNGANG